MPSYQLRVNGESRSVDVRDPDEPLLYVLRNELRLTGAKFGCGLAQCGACTVLVDGQPTRSCTLPVSRVGSADVTTIEGVGSPTSRIRCRLRSSPSRRRNAAIARTAW